MALCPGLPGRAGIRKVKPIWILLKQETVSGSGMQVSTLLQTDNHANTPPLSFFTGRMIFLLPNQQHQSTENKTQLEGKYSLESTDLRESEIHAHLRP